MEWLRRPSAFFEVKRPRLGVRSGRRFVVIAGMLLLAMFASPWGIRSVDGQTIPSRSRRGGDEPSSDANELLSESEWKRGYHGLSILCQSQQLQIVDLAEWQRLDVNETMLILLGDVSGFPIDLQRYVDAGGALLVASDRDSGRTLNSLGLQIEDGPVRAQFARDAYEDVSDCVMIRSFSASHPATKGVRRLVTNRPGLMGISLASDRLQSRQRGVLANYPLFRSRRGIRRPYSMPIFGWYAESTQGGRLIVVADQSMFSNQMLVHGDNAMFLQQSLEWLVANPQTGVSRRQVLIVAGQPLPPLDPSMVEVMPPPPDPSEVAKALQNLPPDVLLDFANSVVATIEEEGIMNEMLRDSFRKQPPVVIRRWLLVVPAVIVASLLVWRLVTGSNTNDRERGTTSLIGEAFEPDSADAGYERFLAAHELFCSFQTELARIDGSRSMMVPEESPFWSDVPRRYQREIRALSKELRRFRRDYWTEKRLVQIEQQVVQWNDWCLSTARARVQHPSDPMASP